MKDENGKDDLDFFKETQRIKILEAIESAGIPLPAVVSFAVVVSIADRDGNPSQLSSVTSAASTRSAVKYILQCRSDVLLATQMRPSPSW